MGEISEKQITEPRAPVSTMIVGAQRTGKTKFIVDLMQNYKKKALVVVPDGFEQKYKSWKLVTLETMGKNHREQIVFDWDDKFFLKTLRQKFMNGALIFDDTKFCLRPWNYLDFEDIIGRNRQVNVDVFCMYHSFARIPEFFWTYCKRLVLFKTILVDNNKQYRAMQYHVNELARTNPYARVMFNLDA